MIQPQSTYRCEVMSWVKGNCLSLAGLLKYLSAREKVNLFKIHQSQTVTVGEGGVNQRNVKQKRDIFSTLVCRKNLPVYVHLGHAAVICTHQQHFKSAFGCCHSLLTRISPCVLTLYSDK